MTRSAIYTVAGGNLTAMTPAAPKDEDEMQRLIGDHPEVIADEDGPLLLVRREQPIADGEAGARWSLDHLFVSRDGVPVLVEVKRAVDTRLRREVVGQLLDYAANGNAHWKAGVIAESFAATAAQTGHDPDLKLLEFLDGGMAPDAFWAQVDANFSAGRMKLVFVADAIPRELARIVEFLNEQMRAEVRAVELSWFTGGGVTALAPRVIGRTERAAASKSSVGGALPPINREEWIANHLAPFGATTVAGADYFVTMVAEAGGRAEVTKAQGSILAVFDLPDTTLYPFSIAPYGRGMVSLNLGYLQSRPAYAGEDTRRLLYDQLTDIVGVLSTKKLSGFPGFALVKLDDATIRTRVAALLQSILAATRGIDA
jgi:hypothetical protein